MQIPLNALILALTVAGSLLSWFAAQAAHLDNLPVLIVVGVFWGIVGGVTIKECE